MCGILGVLAKNSSKISRPLLSKVIHNLYLLSETRGKEASGISYIENGSIKVIKKNVAASRLLRSEIFKQNVLKYIKKNDPNQDEVFNIIGHSRLVTNGDSSFHFNNQPVIAGDMVAVHNGIIVNDDQLWKKFPELKRNYQVDTEILLNLIRYFFNINNSLIDATRKTFQEIKGATSIAVQFKDLNNILLATNNGSLYLGYSKNLILFASEKFIIDSTLRKYPEIKSLAGEINVFQIESGNGLIIDLESLEKADFKLVEQQSATTSTIKHKSREIIDLLANNENSYGCTVYSKSVPSEFDRIFEQRQQRILNLRRCVRCVLPETMPFIHFNDAGICSYCLSYTPIKLKGKNQLTQDIQIYNKKSDQYNCIVSLSGGRDSSYGLHYVVNNLGMHPVTYTYDWGMVTDLARRNISRLCGKLGLEHILISADIRKKRENIRKNVLAWLKKPDLGMIPLFMAGDKQFFYHGEKLKKQFNLDLTILSENLLEKTSFKTGFSGIDPYNKGERIYSLSFAKKIQLILYYFKNYLQNSAYLNSSLIDTFLAYCSYYVMNHNFLFLYNYIPWNEKEVEKTLIEEYDWELATDTETSWRIGDGTAPFYNYIYYMVAGFTENDTFRSNQIRENQITREEAMERIITENRPRWESIQWYCNAIRINFEDAIKAINNIPPLY